jgi:F420-dependent oxidoreductase-like protein
MRFNVMTEPQEGATYEQLRQVAQRAEELGFEGFFRSDHYTSLGPRADAGSTDAWATLSGLARDTSSIRLGSLMSPITWRHPVVLAKTVATVDEMSGGRIELGIGAGWQPVEHQQYGFEFEDFKRRFKWLEESLEIIIGLWTQDRTTVEGTRFSVNDAPFIRKPLQQPHPPILVGGAGGKRTPRLAAKYAQEWNATLADPKVYGERRATVLEACEKIGRDPKTIACSLMSGVLVGADEAEFKDRAHRMYRLMSGNSDDNFEPWANAIRGQWIAGSAEEAANRLGEYAEAGCERVMLQFFDLDDLDHLDVVLKEVRPRLGG